MLVVAAEGSASEGLWQEQVVFQESRDFLGDTNFYKLTTVCLRNLTNTAPADYVLIRKKEALTAE